MTKDQMAALTQRQLEAYNKRDLKAFCDCYHAEVKILNLMTGEVLSEGKEKFTEGYKRLFDSSPKLHCELKHRIIADSVVIDEEWVTGAGKYPDGFHGVAIYGFRDGLIDRIWFPR